MAKKKQCKHLDLMFLDTDQMPENKVYKDKVIVEYDDVKIYIFNCKDCGKIITKPWLRCHFKQGEN